MKPSYIVVWICKEFCKLFFNAVNYFSRYQIKKKILNKSNLSLYSLYYAETCKELARLIFASLRPGNTARSKKCPNGGEPLATLCSIWLALDLIKPRTSRSRDECVTALPVNKLISVHSWVVTASYKKLGFIRTFRLRINQVIDEIMQKVLPFWRLGWLVV